MTTEVISDGSCKTQHTEVSYDLPVGKSARTPPSTFLFLSSVFKQRRINRDRQAAELVGYKAWRSSEAQKRRRSAAAPSRWAVYRSHPRAMSTRFLKVFRQSASNLSLAAFLPGFTLHYTCARVLRGRPRRGGACKQPHSPARARPKSPSGLIPAGDTGMVPAGAVRQPMVA